ncbi:MAG: alpha/beta hydrolase, partial [Actinomycetota bacterium]
LGALVGPVGWIGLAVLLVSWAGSIVLLARTRTARTVVDGALAEAGIPATEATIPLWRQILAVPLRGRSVERTRGVPFRRVAGRTLKLDIYRSLDDADGRPTLLYIHGGAWTVGDKWEQGLPMMHHLARNGWVCFTANYRLSPGATFPDHVVDMKAALAWIREHGPEYGADPSFVAVSGGSAGGQIASLVALTENDPRYQPGFEDVDTSVQAAVSIYGIYDFTNRLGVQSDSFVPLLMEPIVMKAFLEEEPEKFAEASPIDRIHSEAPPYLIAQGDRDTMAPVAEARAFVERLTEVSNDRVVYMEFPGAQHIFDLFYSQQAARMIEGVHAFLEDERRRRRD